MISRRRARVLVSWLLGFFLIANFYPTLFLEQGPRVTDVLGALLGFWLLWRYATTGVRAKPFIALALIGSVPSLWILLAFFGETSSIVMSVRWLLAIPWAYALWTVARDPQQRTSLAWGLWWGCVFNAAVLLVQFLGFVDLTQTIGLAYPNVDLISIYDDLGTSSRDRIPGMHGHPNGTAAVVSLVIPVGLYLYYARAARIWIVVASLCILLVGTEFTYTRSALLVSFATMIVVFAVSLASRRTLTLAALLVYAGLPALAWLGPPGGWERWLEPTSIETNSSIRLLSNAESLRISLENPLGLGVEGGRAALRSAGFEATHNAFLQVAAIYGLLFAVFILLLMLVLALRVFEGMQTGRALEVLLAVQLFGLFFWEEHFNSPTIIVLTSWLVAASAACLGSRLAVAWPWKINTGEQVSR